jgi:hypothetical protein
LLAAIKKALQVLAPSFHTSHNANKANLSLNGSKVLRSASGALRFQHLSRCLSDGDMPHQKSSFNNEDADHSTDMQTLLHSTTLPSLVTTNRICIQAQSSKLTEIEFLSSFDLYQSTLLLQLPCSSLMFTSSPLRPSSRSHPFRAC